MSPKVEQSPENNGLVHVDHEVLDSLKKSWLVPRGTGNLSSQNRQNASCDERLNSTLQLKTEINKK